MTCLNQKHHFIFDVDGTLVQSSEFDEAIFVESILEVTGVAINRDWNEYPHVTDQGILRTFVERQLNESSYTHFEEMVKPLFIAKIREYLSKQKARPVEGALEFFQHVTADPEIEVSIVTGGWRDSAVAKLASAGFDVNQVPIMSSDDHFSRAELIKRAIRRVSSKRTSSTTYFGDAEWDIRACEELGINLVLVGAGAKYHQQINDFAELDKLKSFIHQ